MITGVHWFGSVGIVQVVRPEEKEQFRQTGEADFDYYIGKAFNDNEIERTGVLFPKGPGDLLFGRLPRIDTAGM